MLRRPGNLLGGRDLYERLHFAGQGAALLYHADILETNTCHDNFAGLLRGDSEVTQAQLMVISTWGLCSCSGPH